MWGGYGYCRYNGKWMSAHRAEWLRQHGSIPAGLFVLRRCDNPICRRASHLFIGTHADNMRDKAEKGRARGMDGQRHSEKTKSKMRLIAKLRFRIDPTLALSMGERKRGVIYGADVRARMSAAHKGKTMSAETRKNMSVAQQRRRSMEAGKYG